MITSRSECTMHGIRTNRENFFNLFEGSRLELRVFCGSSATSTAFVRVQSGYWLTASLSNISGVSGSPLMPS